jgi:hypothetical protein
VKPLRKIELSELTSPGSPVSNEFPVLPPNLSPSEDSDSEPDLRTAAEVAEARAYLIETASPGYTMTLQGPEVAIGRVHPEFAIRLESAIREARSAGLPFAGIFSAYRPPAFGIGGFSDKFNSLHTYGLAVDMHGIGSPGSPEAQLWHQIAAKNGVVCPYGPRARTEWNHCQPTSEVGGTFQFQIFNKVSSPEIWSEILVGDQREHRLAVLEHVVAMLFRHYRRHR